MSDSPKTSIALKKALTLLTKVQKMHDDGEYCIDIIQQVLAVIGLLRSVNEQILAGHLRHCFTDAMESSDAKKMEEMVNELLKVIETAQKK